MDDRTVDLIFAGSLENLPPVSSKIVRIFTSSTFTGTLLLYTTIMNYYLHCEFNALKPFKNTSQIVKMYLLRKHVFKSKKKIMSFNK